MVIKTLIRASVLDGKTRWFAIVNGHSYETYSKNEALSEVRKALRFFDINEDQLLIEGSEKRYETVDDIIQSLSAKA